MINSPAHPANRARAEEMSRVTGVEITAEQVYYGNIPEEAAELWATHMEERTAEIRTNAEFREAADDMQYRFLDALGVERSFWGGHKGIWNEGDVREVIATKTPTEFLDALSVASPETSGIVELVKGDAELAAAFHRAVVQDPTMLPGLQSIMHAGEGEFNLQDMQELLADAEMRGHLTRVLERVAEGQTADGQDITFAHLQALINAERSGNRQESVRILGEIGAMPEGMAQQVGFQFLADLFTIGAEGAISNLMGTLIETGQITAEEAQMYAGFLAPIAGILQGTVQPYADIAQNYGLTSAQGFTNFGNQMAANATERGGELFERTGLLRDGVYTRAVNGEIDPEAVSANPRTEVTAETRVAAAPAAPAPASA